MSLRYRIMCAAVVVGFFVSNAPPVFGAAVCTNTLTPSVAVPNGYGAAYNFFTTQRELLVRSTSCDDTSITVAVGSGDASQYVYNQGYFWDGTRWVSYSLTGTTASTGWLAGSATATFRKVGATTYFVGYVCQQVNNTWKCGCRDATCGTSSWQLQTVSSVADTNPGGNTGTGTGTGSGSGGTNLVARGLREVWRDSFEQNIGKVPTTQVMFGTYGRESRYIASAAAPTDNRIIARAPDGRAAIQYNIPKGSVPMDTMRSVHFPSGTSHAGLSADLWVPADFEFPSTCLASSNSPNNPGQGRWPMGMWIGGNGNTMANGVGLQKQDGISVRFNREKSSSGQTAASVLYSYHLNRSPALCSADGVGCGTQCTDPNTKCFGGVSNVNTGTLPRGRWVPFEMEIKLNTPGQRNGCLAYWFDGVKKYESCKFDLGADRGWSVKGFYSWNMWHCDGSPKVQKYWMSNVRIFSK